MLCCYLFDLGFAVLVYLRLLIAFGVACLVWLFILYGLNDVFAFWYCVARLFTLFCDLFILLGFGFDVVVLSCISFCRFWLYVICFTFWCLCIVCYYFVNVLFVVLIVCCLLDESFGLLWCLVCGGFGCLLLLTLFVNLVLGLLIVCINCCLLVCFVVLCLI